MQLIYLINYSVKGIKSLDEDVKLSFYKKTISKNPDMNGYNIKGIYGMNGSGKSGIVTSVKILKNILTDSGYLNNPIIQKNLDAIINKKTGQLSIESDFMVKILDSLVVCRYKLILSKDVTGRYSIVYERLSTKKATSRSDNMKIIFEVINGNIEILEIDDGELLKDVIEKTRNLLTMESMSSLFYEKFLIPEAKKKTLQNIMEKSIYIYIWLLFFFGRKLHVYLDQSDNHREYIAISKLTEFLRIFKSDLKGIEIDKKENQDVWICDLVMNYETYNIHAEYESTGTCE